MKVLFRETIKGTDFVVTELGPAKESAVRRRAGLRVCPFCMKQITPKDGLLYLVVSVSAMPSKIVHANCFNKTAAPVAIGQLQDYWQEAQQYAHWFE
jgi:hypothetical protein